MDPKNRALKRRLGNLIPHKNWSGKLIRNISSTEAAYLAAIIDGEGAIWISRKLDPTMRRGFAYRLNVSVSNTHHGLLKWMLRKTGIGSVNSKHVKNKKHKPVWRYELWSLQAYQFLKRIFQYLICKKRQASHAFKLMESKNDGVGRNGMTDVQWNLQESIYAKMKVLNKRGI